MPRRGIIKVCGSTLTICTSVFYVIELLQELFKKKMKYYASIIPSEQFIDW